MSSELGQVAILSNDALTKLDGLDEVTTIAYFIVGDNASLTTLESLSALATVHEGLDVFENARLTHLGLDSLTSAAGLQIYGNPMLPTCEATNLVEQLEGFTGMAEIHGNDDEGSCE